MMSIAFSFLRNYSVFFMLSILQTKKKSHKIYLLHRGLEIGKKCNETKKITVRPSHFSNFFWHLKITYKICVNLKSRLSNGLIVPQINMLTCLDSNGIFLEFRLLWVGLGLTKAYKNEQYNTRLILDPNETFNIIFSDQRNVVNRCSNSTSLFVTFDLRTLCVIIWITRTKYVILLMFHTQWVCLMIKKEQFFKGCISKYVCSKVSL